MNGTGNVDILYIPQYSLTLHRATSFWARLRGLHAYAGLPWHAGLYIPRCNTIHTFGLPYAIDVAFLDARHRVIGYRHHLRPWRLAHCGGAVAVVELPAGYCLACPGYPDAIRMALALW